MLSPEQVYMRAGIVGEAAMDCWLSHPTAKPLAKIKARDVWQEFAGFQTFIRGAFGGDMAAIKRPRKSGTTSWVNVALSEEDQNEIVNSEYTDEQIFADVLSLVISGFEVRIKQQTGEDSYIAMLFPVADNHPFTGHAMSAFAPTPLVALRALLYKHFRVLGEDWSSHFRNGASGIG